MDTAGYYDDHWQKRGGLLSGDMEFRKKVQFLSEMVPSGVHSILDVGCGDGSITNAFVARYDVTGVDLSSVGLRRVDPRVQRILASADALPFADGHFDMVFSSELLEHLDTPTLERAVSEFRRLARRYILISVPNNEKLRKRCGLCKECGHEFHVYGHVHSFSLPKLRRLLSGWRLEEWRTCGYPDTPSVNLVSWLRNRIANNYFQLPGVQIICPRCGSELEETAPNGIQVAVDFLLRAVQKALLCAVRAKAEPDWLLALFSRPCHVRKPGEVSSVR